jgi:hypothetical protein
MTFGSLRLALRSKKTVQHSKTKYTSNKCYLSLTHRAIVPDIKYTRVHKHIPGPKKVLKG